MSIAETPQGRREPEELAQEDGLRAALEYARLLAVQSKLLALNAAFESAGAGTENSVIGEMDVLATEADRAAAQADRVSSTVEAFLQQIQSAAAFARQGGCGRPPPQRGFNTVPPSAEDVADQGRP